MCAACRWLYVRPEAVRPNDRHHENIRLVVIVVSPPSLQVPRIEVISSAKLHAQRARKRDGEKERKETRQSYLVIFRFSFGGERERAICFDGERGLLRDKANARIAREWPKRELRRRDLSSRGSEGKRAFSTDGRPIGRGKLLHVV